MELAFHPVAAGTGRPTPRTEERFMKSSTWLSILVAAALVLAGGALLALAAPGEEAALADQRVIVDANGTLQTIGLEDLADGESREIAAGDHTVTVTRSGQQLAVLLDGKDLMGEAPVDLGRKAVVWVGEEGNGQALADRVVVFKGAAGEPAEARTLVIRTREGEGDEEVTVDVHAIADAEWSELDAASGKHTMIFTSAEPGSEPVVVSAPGRRPGMVRYRCEATGSELLVDKDQATAESYVCPATGCVMIRVEEPEVRVIKVVKTVKESDTEPTE
jgi:hypothetical protein